MKIVSWNVNSIRKRAELVQMFIEEHKPDVICLQEIKCQDDQFPAEFFYNLGYHVQCNGQKSYNGVAILTKQPARLIIKKFAEIEDARFISVIYQEYHICCIYVPNGQMVGSPAYEKQKKFLTAVIDYIKQYKSQKLLIAGDFNVVPEDEYADFALRSSFICDATLKGLWHEIIGLGLTDPFGAEYTWYDYRWPKMGARIDSILTHQCTHSNAKILRKYRNEVVSPSDHCPLMIEV